MAAPRSNRALLAEVLARPHWTWHRLVGKLEGRDPRAGRLAEYERFTEPLESAVARMAGARAEDVAKTLASFVPVDRAQGSGPIPRWQDGTLELSRVAYAIVRALKPEVVVETGVARGVTSHAILSALEDNGRGRLVSVDLPGLEAGATEAVGELVPEALRARWDLRLGPSASLLPGILRGVGPVDLFIHDSAHTYRNMAREYALGLAALKPEGVLMSDDVCNDALLEIVERERLDLAVVRQSKAPPWSYIGLAKRRAT
ncbi:MAG TPA: class I SAM-dependent methyltransferase [Candidatus Thermoplasmatota archaeon]|nr:class I SAM-dependent methyltransferase [Candidatus Thermoplasmatota archaeon]